MKVKLKIKTSQYLEGSDFQTIESYYKGEQIEKNGNIYITFSEFDTSKERSSTIKISDEEVLLLKSGDITSRMKFREDRDFRSKYRTPYGVFDMDLHTYKISKRISDKELKLNLDYKISIRGLMDSNNRLEMKVVPEV